MLPRYYDFIYQIDLYLASCIFQMNNRLLYIYLFLALLQLTSSVWQTLSSGFVSIPAHIYKVQINYNQILKATLIWNNNNTNIDLYLYKLGSDLLNNDQTLMKSTSNNMNVQSFTFIAPQYNSYFIKLYKQNASEDKEQQDQIITYTLTLTVNTTSVVYSGFFIQKYWKFMPFNISNPIIFSNIAFRYRTSSSIINSSMIIFKGQQYKIQTQKIKRICLQNSQALDFILVIQQNLASVYNLISLNYILEYNMNFSKCPSECSTDENWDYASQQCKKTNYNTNSSISNLAIIITAVLVPIFFIGLAVALSIICYRKHRNNRVQNQSSNISKSMQNLHDTEADIHRQQNCCICLGQGCNVSLPCNHYFHKNCITQWIKKNQLCPLCRNPV